MVKIQFDNDDSIISEEHLYIIMFGLEDAKHMYKLFLEDINKKDYKSLTGEELYLRNCYSNRILDIDKLLEEIGQSIHNIDSKDRREL